MPSSTKSPKPAHLRLVASNDFVNRAYQPSKGLVEVFLAAGRDYRDRYGCDRCPDLEARQAAAATRRPPSSWMVSSH